MTSRLRAASAAAFAALLITSCGGRTDPLPDESGDVWTAAVLREYDGVSVRDIYALDSGFAAVYYDMTAEDYLYDLFSDSGEYIAQVHPSDLSGCPKARMIVPHDGGCLLADRENGVWLVSGTDDSASAERLTVCPDAVTAMTYYDGLAYIAAGGMITVAGKDSVPVSVRVPLVSGLYPADDGVYAKYSRSKGELYFSRITPDGSLKEPINVSGDIGIDQIYAKDGVIYIRDRIGVLGQRAGMTSSRLLGWSESGVSPSFLSGWAVKDENTVIAAEYDHYKDGDNCRLSLIRRGETDETAALPEIRAAFVIQPYDIGTAAAQMLREKTARVELVDYSSKADPQSELRGDILSGNAPDVILLDGVILRDDYIRSGLFADLMPYIEASGDSVLNEAARPFVTDGRIFELPASLSLSFLTVKGDEMPGRTVGELIAFAEDLTDKGIRPFASGSAQSLLSMLLTASIPDFIGSGFDSPDFASMLEFCAGYPSVRFEDDDPVISEFRLASYDGYLRLNSLSEKEIIGYPSASGSGIMLTPANSLALCASSGHKDEAWRFITVYRELIGSRTNEERQLPFAMTDDEREKTRKLAEKIDYFFYYSGGEASAFLGDDGSCWLDKLTENDGVRARVTDEIIDRCDSLINSAQRQSSASAALTDIIIEEASYYFSGAKTLDETVRIISSRAGIYLAETGYKG